MGYRVCLDEWMVLIATCPSLRSRIVLQTVTFRPETQQCSHHESPLQSYPRTIRIAIDSPSPSFTSPIFHPEISLNFVQEQMRLCTHNKWQLTKIKYIYWIWTPRWNWFMRLLNILFGRYSSCRRFKSGNIDSVGQFRHRFHGRVKLVMVYA